MSCKKQKKLKEEHTYVFIEITNYQACTDTSLNLELRQLRSLFSQEDDPAFIFETMLKIEGICTYPEERANDTYEITIWSGERHSGQFSVTLRDYQVRDKHGIPKYREYRGKRYPVYEGPRGLGPIEKLRGRRYWQTWTWVKPALASDMLVLLTQIQPLYLTIHELKSGRNRWVQSLSLQTTDPAEE